MVENLTSRKAQVCDSRVPEAFQLSSDGNWSKNDLLMLFIIAVFITIIIIIIIIINVKSRHEERCVNSSISDATGKPTAIEIMKMMIAVHDVTWMAHSISMLKSTSFSFLLATFQIQEVVTTQEQLTFLFQVSSILKPER